MVIRYLAAGSLVAPGRCGFGEVFDRARDEVSALPRNSLGVSDRSLGLL